MIIQKADGTIIKVHASEEVTREKIVAKREQLVKQLAELPAEIQEVEADLAEFDRLNPQTEGEVTNG